MGGKILSLDAPPPEPRDGLRTDRTRRMSAPASGMGFAGKRTFESRAVKRNPRPLRESSRPDAPRTSLLVPDSRHTLGKTSRMPYPCQKQPNLVRRAGRQESRSE